MENNDNQIKQEMMSEMISDLIGVADDPASANALADHLIRKGWRKDK